jgi:hypothetical protein
VEVLRRRAQHGWPADVDLLDHLVRRHTTARGGLPEGVEVHGHEVYRKNLVLGERSHVVRHLAPGEERAVNGGVQRLHPPVHHLRKARDLADVERREPRLAEDAGSAAGGDELPAERGEPAGELREPGLIGYRQ